MDTSELRDYLVLDMTSMRFSWASDRTALSLLTQRGEMVAIISTQPAADPREEAYRVLDAALDKGRVLRAEGGGRTRYRIAFYNPYTAEVSVGRTGEVSVVSDGQLLELAGDGTPALLERTPEGPVLHVPGRRRLTHRPASFATLTRALASHSA